MENVKVISKELAVDLTELQVLFQVLCIASELDNLLSLRSELSIF